jgi:epoxyqueuosine reductase
MAYLERFRERILDPRKIRAEGRSLLVVGLSHARAPIELGGGARMARYAASRDYHNVIGKQLRKLGRRLQAEGFGEHWRKIVDAGPLLERSHAAEAGLGFESKAANLLSQDHGPWFFLGELILQEELAPSGRADLGSCGTCTACLDACPTQAIVAPGVVHSPLCISYQTIENSGEVPHELRSKLGEWVFGCDVCSEVCPHGEAAVDVSSRSGTHPAVARAMDAEEGPLAWLIGDRDELDLALRGSPLKRAGTGGLARNVALFLGNRPSEDGRTALLQALTEHADPEVRLACAWSLGEAFLQDAGVRTALERSAQRDPDERVSAEARAALSHS